MAHSRKRPGAAQKRGRDWRRIDLHLHTPASKDYQEPHISYLDILRQAEARNLSLIAFTDHNTVAGYAAMKRHLEQLEMLEKLDRLKADEERRLREYRRLLEKIVVLPGFEFTATFGFHILGVFSPDTPVTFLEHLLLTLNISPTQLQAGSSTVGATADVLTAYKVINQAGGLVIAAHANSGNGVIMRGLDFGGQTKMTYTQDPNLHCLEVTDLEKHGRYATRRFFDGSKPEYPRPMRCIQGSDAHRLVRDTSSSKHLGVGDRVTEILLKEVTFEDLAEVLKGNDFSLTRPFRGPAKPADFVLVAREEGPSIVQSFHASMAQRGGHLNRILQDICAMANTNGGTVYIGLSENINEKIVGVRDHKNSIEFLHSAISKHLSPDPNVNIDSLASQGKAIVRVIVPPGRDLPYAMDDKGFYVRDEAETTLAVRDEVIRLVERRVKENIALEPPLEIATQYDQAFTAPKEVTRSTLTDGQVDESPSAPRTGVQIVASEERNGTIYHTVRDLRNGNLIKNVTKSSARKLWHYAITQVESNDPKEEDIPWQGNIAVVDERRRENYSWYDLALRDSEGVHIYYGVTDSGMNEQWMKLVEKHGEKHGR